MSKKKNILNAHVARVIKGVLVSAGPGDEAPDWVTDTTLFESATEAGEPTVTPVVPPTPAPTPPAAPAASTVEDDLSDLGIAELRETAINLGLAKKGSKAEIADRIRAHRAAAADSALPEAGNPDREALIEKATALGTPDAGDLTDDELLATIESAGE